MTEPWVSLEDIAKHLGVAKDSVYRWFEKKGLPAHRMGRLWKFTISEVFYNIQPPRQLEEIEADIRAVEKEILSMLAEVAG